VVSSPQPACHQQQNNTNNSSNNNSNNNNNKSNFHNSLSGASTSPSPPRSPSRAGLSNVPNVAFPGLLPEDRQTPSEDVHQRLYRDDSVRRKHLGVTRKAVRKSKAEEVEALKKYTIRPGKEYELQQAGTRLHALDAKQRRKFDALRAEKEYEEEALWEVRRKAGQPDSAYIQMMYEEAFHQKDRQDFARKENEIEEKQWLEDVKCTAQSRPLDRSRIDLLYHDAEHRRKRLAAMRRETKEMEDRKIGEASVHPNAWCRPNPDNGVKRSQMLYDESRCRQWRRERQRAALNQNWRELADPRRHHGMIMHNDAHQARSQMLYQDAQRRQYQHEALHGGPSPGRSLSPASSWSPSPASSLHHGSHTRLAIPDIACTGHMAGLVFDGANRMADGWGSRARSSPPPAAVSRDSPPCPCGGSGGDRRRDPEEGARTRSPGRPKPAWRR